MTTETKVKWALEADYLQACNCDYGCPCEFEAPPTSGYCEGILAWRINRGHYGDVSLDGLELGNVLHFPGAMHEGNGVAVWLLDEKANEQQREALIEIATGKAGGMPFEALATLFSKRLEPQFVPFEFSINGKESSVKMGDVAAVALEPIKNPVTGEPEDIRIEHGTGFIFKGADAVSAKECRASVGELNFSYPDKCGFVTQVKYGN